MARKIGILGSGDVGQALGRGFARHGWDVKLGSRSPASEKLGSWQKSAKGVTSTGTFAEAAAHGDVVVLAVAGSAALDVLDLVGLEKLAGKLLLDATNPLDASKGMPPGLFVGTTDSLGERVQRKAPAANVVKCFNTVGNRQMVDPAFEGGRIRMLVCGNDAQAKARTDAILREIGWAGALDVGGIDGARWLEAIVPLWVRVGIADGEWGHAFHVVRAH